MTWTEICKDPTLQDLPYKIETNEFGQIVMSPASNNHGRYQMRIGLALGSLIDNGEVISECSVDTRHGVKVADVAWLSSVFGAIHGIETPFTSAPELCVEVVSPSNSRNELSLKRKLYFEAGAVEVWFCDASGQMSFFDVAGEMSASRLFPAFPGAI